MYPQRESIKKLFALHMYNFLYVNATDVYLFFTVGIRKMYLSFFSSMIRIVKSLFHISTGLFYAVCLVLTKIDTVTVREDRSVTVFKLPALRIEYCNSNVKWCAFLFQKLYSYDQNRLNKYNEVNNLIIICMIFLSLLLLF